MCHRLFIASDLPLPLVAPAHPKPIFDVAAVPPAEIAALPFPVGWQVVEAGSTSGCACDFHKRNPGSRQFLASYLRPLAGRQQLLIYSTWYGEEAVAHVRQAALPVDRLQVVGDPIPQQTLTPII